MALLSEHTLTITDAFVVRQIDTPEGFRAMEGPWRELFTVSACPSVFSSWEWISEWCAHFVPALCRQGIQAAPVLLAVYNRQRLLVGLTAFIDIRTPYSLIGERRLIQIGMLCIDGLEPEEPVFLCRPEYKREAIRAIQGHLMVKPSANRWNHFTMLVHQPFGKVTDGKQSKGQGSLWEQSHTLPGPLTVLLPTTWEEFRGRLGKSMRHNLPYYPRRLTRTGRSWAVRLLETRDEVESAVPLLSHLHKKRAESHRGYKHLDHLSTPTHTAFLGRCLPLLAARGMAFVAALEVDGVTIATQAFLQSAGVMTFYYSGFDPEWYEFSPITIIGETVMRRAIEQRMSKINFLSDKHSWKTRWRAQQEGFYQFLVGFSPHPVSLAYALIRRGYRKRNFLEVELSGFTKDGAGGQPKIRPIAKR